MNRPSIGPGSGTASPLRTRAQPAVLADAYSVAVRFVRLLLRLFFREVTVRGAERVPADGGGLLIAWHPNGLIDPALIVAGLPRKVVFGARHGLFKWPILGRLMKALGTVPIYRASDLANVSEQERREANAGSVGALAQAVADSSFAALFPEGLSHDDPFPQQLKTGAARLYYQARALRPEGQEPCIIPVGLHYDKKQLFRSRVLVEFHEPLQLSAELRAPLPEDEAGQRERCRALTAEFDRVLRDVVRATETWRLHRLMDRTRSLVRAERAARTGVALDAPDMVELSAGFRRVWAGYYERRRTKPDEVAALLKRVRAYERDLTALGLDDHELDRSRSRRERWKPVGLILKAVLVYVIAPPLLLLGYLVNAPVWYLLRVFTRRLATLNKDAATLKLLGGLLLYPLAWLAVAMLVGFGVLKAETLYPNLPANPMAAGVTVFFLCGLGGALVLFYSQMLRETWHALRTRLTRRRRWLTVDHLKHERASLHDDIVELARGADLPGKLLPDGRVLPT